MIFDQIPKNFRYFLFKAGAFGLLALFVRTLFKLPLDLYKITIFAENTPDNIFNKIMALEVVIVIAIIFALYNKDRITKLAHQKINIKQSLLLFVGALFSVALYYFLRYYTNIHELTQGALTFIIIAKILLLALAAVFLLTASFSIHYLKKLWSTFRKELLIALAAVIILYLLMQWFQSLWLFFSTIITVILAVIFQPFYPTHFRFLSNGPQMTIADFSVSIGQSCSGIDSMLLFSAFFLAIIALDFKRIHKKRAILFFLLGFLGVYVVNIVRLTLLMLVGIHLSPEFAVGMFHTNAGWFLFVLYFLGFFLFVRRWLYIRK